MIQISCVLFDIGGVLVDWHMSWITSEISKRFSIAENRLVSSFETHLHKLDTGNISENDFWNFVAIDTDSDSLKNCKESLWNTYFRKNAKPNQNIKNLSTTLKQKGLIIGIVSNIEQVTHNVVEDWNMLEHFDHKFMSYQIGFSKPDPRIYEYVIEKLPFREDEILFIDDKQSNIESAKTCGIHTIHFTGFNELITSLDSYSLNSNII